MCAEVTIGSVFLVDDSVAEATHPTDPSLEQIGFKDVAGMGEAKEEIVEFVSFLKDPERCAGRRRLDPSPLRSRSRDPDPPAIPKLTRKYPRTPPQS